MISSRIEVRRYSRPGEWPNGDRQELQRRYHIGRLCVFVRVLDSETIPVWAVIQLGALGYTDWRSKFADFF